MYDSRELRVEKKVSYTYPLHKSTHFSFFIPSETRKGLSKGREDDVT